MAASSVAVVAAVDELFRYHRSCEAVARQDERWRSDFPQTISELQLRDAAEFTVLVADFARLIGRDEIQQAMVEAMLRRGG